MNGKMKLKKIVKKKIKCYNAYVQIYGEDTHY